MKKIAIVVLILLIIWLFFIKPPTVNSINPQKIQTPPEIKREQKEEKIEQKIIKKSFAIDDERQDLINYAYNLGGKDFVLTLDGENGLWTTHRKSLKKGANGYFDFGICQLNKKYHGKFINSKEFDDPYKQIDYCWGVWQNAMKKGKIKTTFYAFKHRHKNAVRFENL